LSIRRLDYAGGFAGLLFGAAITPAALHGDPSRLLGTFLGLVSASILPSISLILASMTTGGRSVHAIDRLRNELMAATDALLQLLGLVGAVFAAVFTLSIAPPDLAFRVPWLATEILPRFGQAVVIAGSTVILLRASLVPAILRRCLLIRHEIAVDEAKKKTMENAAKVGEAQKFFPRDPTFGRTVPLADVHDPDRH
jgi:hypothetical protein